MKKPTKRVDDAPPLRRQMLRRLDAGDERGTRHAVRIELRDPAVRQRVGGARVVPLQLAADIRADWYGVCRPLASRAC